MARIYKILRDAEWQSFEARGETNGAPVDVADGFIHFSTASQVGETARLHFAGEDRLWLIGCDAEVLGTALRWEPSRDGARFPHLYRALRRSDVADAVPLPLGPGGHVFPAGLDA